ncbi:hypothetical protein [Bartonella sp. LJL80]
MMSLLSNGSIKALFSSVLSSIYEDGQLIRSTMVRDPKTGSMRPVKQPPVTIKVQIDECTEAMRQQAGYTDTDVRMIILQQGIEGEKPNSDDLIVAGGQNWKVYGVTEDPAHSYWQMRAVRQASK